MAKGDKYPYTGMTQREIMFVQMAARRVVRSLLMHVPLMKEAGREAKAYYNEKSPHRTYWEGWDAAMDSIVAQGEGEVKDLIRSMGGNRKALHIANGVAQGVRNYEMEVSGKVEPLEITQESFEIFHETV